MGESRATTRPRPSLSCATCRRRKVRCTKEQPACNSCVRTNEVCKYDLNAWKKASIQAKQKQKTCNRNKNTNPNKDPFPTPQQEDWVEWTGRSQNSTQSRTNSIESIPAQSNHMPPSPANSGHDEGLFDRDDTPLFPTMDAGDLYLSEAEANAYEDFATNVSWNMDNVDGHIAASNLQRQDTRLLSPASTVSPHSQSTQNRPHARSDVHPQKALSMTDNSTQAMQSPMIWPSTTFGLDIKQPTIETNKNSPRPPGLLSISSGAQIRYVGAAFWGYVKNCEHTCEKVLRCDREAPKDMPQPHIDAPALANLLPLLPPKPVCNMLLYAFLIGVRPIYPLIHVPTFHADYDDFWRWYSNLDTASPTCKLIEDPTFLSLMFTVLYCGAATAPLSLWTAGVLQSVKRDSVLEQLKSASFASLKFVQHLRFPTFNTLVALLFRHSCLKQEGEPHEDSGFVGTVVRIAQNMGLHLDGSRLGIDVVACEVRRRVWWHILWLDVQNSVLNGSPLCCHHDNQYTAQMVSEIQDKDIHETASPVGFLTSPTQRSSASMLVAMGRFETSRFERLMVNGLQSAPSADCFHYLEKPLRNVQILLDSLRARLPAKGIPEKGLIPSRIANASPLTQKRLYGDAMEEPTVFTSWARIMLTMLKTEVTIMFQKGLLGCESNVNDQRRTRWNSLVELSTSYLRNFLQCIQIPAFEPYAWFSSTHLGPLQAVFLILTYLQDNRDVETETQGLYLVDEVLDHLIQEDTSTHNTTKTPTPDTSPNPPDPNWTTLKSLRQTLHLPPSPPQSQPPTFQTDTLPPTIFSTSRPSPHPLHTPSNTPSYLDVPSHQENPPSYFSPHTLDPLLDFTSTCNTAFPSHTPSVLSDTDDPLLPHFSDLDAWSSTLDDSLALNLNLNHDTQNPASHAMDQNMAFTPLVKPQTLPAVSGGLGAKASWRHGSPLGTPGRGGGGAASPAIERAGTPCSGVHALGGRGESARGLSGGGSGMLDFDEALWMDL